MKHIVIFASGTGSNAAKIIDRFRESELARVKLLLCNNPQAGVLETARREGIPVALLDRHDFYHTDRYVKLLQEMPADLVVLAGFLWKIPDNLVRAFAGKMINLHPALLPKYGGKGMYGERVHTAVIAAGDTESGITIHYVNDQYDDGEIILQKTCPVLPGDTPELLAGRIHKLEHTWLPQVVEELLRV
ncbi:phosphoribosylglycinamide formyltransferase [Compostibacter hankyongensis]|uniref:Phosphoribosylglycinamide formyltransferase n=1 Tax=Compostibacter hankyongensis TaxID=1007089 RepID=A0ABP8FE62_9BACT